MLDEALEVLDGLWSGERFSHAGRRFRVDRVTFLPPPAQRSRIPVWVACTWPHRRPLRRAARWDGVVAAWPTPDGGLERLAPDQVAELVAEVRHPRTAHFRRDQRPYGRHARSATVQGQREGRHR